MKKTKRFLSALTALAMTVSAFAGCVIPASAEGGASIVYDGELKITSDVAQTANLIKARYTDDVLDSVKVHPVTLTEGENTLSDIEVSADDVLMLWKTGEDNVFTTQPLTAGKYIVPSVIEPTALIDEDFEAVTDTWGFTTTSGVAVASETVGTETNKYLHLCTTSNNNINTDQKELDSAVKAARALNVSFKWKTDVDFTNGGGRQSVFELLDSEGNVIICMSGSANRTQNYPIKARYAVGTRVSNASEEAKGVQLTDSNDWFTVDLSIDFANGKLSGKITDSENKEFAIEETNISAKNLAKLSATHVASASAMGIDDITVSAAKNLIASNFVITSSDTGNAPVSGASISVANTTLTTDAHGTASVMLPAGTYDVSILAPKHKEYKSQITVSESSTSFPIELEYAGEPVPTTIEIAGGDEFLYVPAAGENSTTNAYTATVYDQTNQVMKDAEVTWSLTGDAASNGATIANGIVTIPSTYPVTDINGGIITVRATSASDAKVYKEVELDIRQAQILTDFTVAGPREVKDGKTATYTVENPKDQYGEPFTGTATYTISSASEGVTVSNEEGAMSAAFDTKTVQTAETQITVTSSNSVAKNVTVTAYAYDFYEKQIGGSVYGTLRTAEVADETYTVWPVSKTTQTLTLPEPVALTAGSKMITYSTAWTTQTVGAQERSLVINFSGTADEIRIGYNGDVYLDPVFSKGKLESGTKFGSQGEASTFEETLIILKTNTEGETTATISYNGDTPITKTIGTNLGSIKSISMVSGDGAPAERLCAIKDIKICDSDIAEVEITGGDKVAKIENKTATKTYKASVFSKEEGEEFTWSVVGTETNAAVEGVEIDQNGVLSVASTVADNTAVTISYASTKNADKKATKEVTIMPYASIVSFDINGPAAVSAGDTATYSVSNIKDEYGDIVEMDASYSITTGGDIAEINPTTGVLTTDAAKTGTITIQVAVGNTDKKKTIDKTVNVAKYFYINESASGTQNIDVTGLDNYTADTEFLVTTAKDGVQVSQTKMKATSGQISVEMGEATALEISPIYSFTSVGNLGDGNSKEIPLADGRYDFTFVKTNGNRADIFVNGDMVGQNVGQYGAGRNAGSPEGRTYTAPDVKVTGGSAVVTMTDEKNMDSITVQKNPSIVTRKTHLYILGDSLVANYAGSYAVKDESTGAPAPGDAQTGWGQLLGNFMGEDINVTNLAESGSDSLMIRDGHYMSVVKQAMEGDYVILECGFNDADTTHHKVGSKANMKSYVAEMIGDFREAGITPILVTPNASRNTYRAGVKWADALLEAATENDTFVVDLATNSYNFLHETYADDMDAIGQNYNLYINGSSPDKYLHSSYVGAMKWAQIVAQGIYDYQQANTTKNEGSESLENLTINTDYSFTFTDTLNKTIQCKVATK